MTAIRVSTMVVAIAVALVASACAAGTPPTAAPAATPKKRCLREQRISTPEPMPSTSRWSVPVDIKFSDCDMGPGDTFGWFESWTGNWLWNAPDRQSNTPDRYQQGPGQVDRLWILDVEGRRLVIDATYMPGSSDGDRTVLQQVVDSIAFRALTTP